MNPRHYSWLLFLNYSIHILMVKSQSKSFRIGTKNPSRLMPGGVWKYGVGRLKKHLSVFFALSRHSFAVFDHLKFCV